MKGIKPFQQQLNDCLLACDQITEAYELIECTMLLEEFRVNRFASEIKTPIKASAKRLSKAFDKLS